MKHRMLVCLQALTLIACQSNDPATAPPPVSPLAPTAAAGTAGTSRYDAVPRPEFNRAAVHLNLPLYWVSDKNGNNAVDPDEVASLLFYPTEGQWVDNGRFTPAFDDAYAKIVNEATGKATAAVTGDEAERRKLVVEDLDQGAPTLVYNDLRGLSEGEKAFVRHILAAARLIDDLYAVQNGIVSLRDQIPADDTASQSLFRRNWGPKCVAPKTENNPKCSALPNGAKAFVDVYPVSEQKAGKFCEALEKRPDAKQLVLDPFSVMRVTNGRAEAVPYAEAYKTQMAAVAGELRAAAASLDANEAPLKAYLTAAAQAFTDNVWEPADEAWAKMNAQNSKFYLRVGPDEVYWEPCSHKAGFHLTFARINPESLQWQQKLVPVQQEMEKTLATLIGAPYKERKVTFHLPDFIDIVFNAGDDRAPIGATIGQSLPNWGKIANEGRGRTVAMSNLYTDPDSLRMRRMQAESLLAAETMAAYSDASKPGLLATILHEATHNLGPAHEYKYRGKTDSQAFGGGLASMMEELKAQSGGLFFVDFLVKRGILTPEQAKQSYVDSVVWAFGHISRGMYTESGKRKPYSQLAAIQMGFLMDEGAITFDPNATSANGTDKGAFTIHFEKMPGAIEKLMKKVGTLKATNDKAGAEALSARYVDGPTVPQAIITERVLRHPKASFVYAFDL